LLLSSSLLLHTEITLHLPKSSEQHQHRLAEVASSIGGVSFLSLLVSLFNSANWPSRSPLFPWGLWCLGGGGSFGASEGIVGNPVCCARLLPAPHIFACRPTPAQFSSWPKFCFLSCSSLHPRPALLFRARLSSGGAWRGLGASVCLKRQFVSSVSVRVRNLSGKWVGRR